MTPLHALMCVMWLAIIALAVIVMLKTIAGDDTPPRQDAGESDGEGFGGHLHNTDIA